MGVEPPIAQETPDHDIDDSDPAPHEERNHLPKRVREANRICRMKLRLKNNNALIVQGSVPSQFNCRIRKLNPLPISGVVVDHLNDVLSRQVQLGNKLEEIESLNEECFAVANQVRSSARGWEVKSSREYDRQLKAGYELLLDTCERVCAEDTRSSASSEPLEPEARLQGENTHNTAHGTQEMTTSELAKDSEGGPGLSPVSSLTSRDNLSEGFDFSRPDDGFSLDPWPEPHGATDEVCTETMNRRDEHTLRLRRMLRTNNNHLLHRRLPETYTGRYLERGIYGRVEKTWDKLQDSFDLQVQLSGMLLQPNAPPT